jgi:hypothetical protein
MQRLKSVRQAEPPDLAEIVWTLAENAVRDVCIISGFYMPRGRFVLI